MCGWCGAISNCSAPVKKERRCFNCYHILDFVLVTTIISLIIVIIGGGVWATFPVLFPELGFSFFLHTAFTSILSFNTLFNYCAASFVQAGPIPDIAWGSVDCVNEGGLRGYRFCHACQKPKPPSAHHCRACNACVNEMDHHCPFIGNCVGAGNHRPFILFLLFTVLSNMYVFTMSLSAIIKIWAQVDLPKVYGVASSTQAMLVIASYLQALLGSSISSSARALALLYLIAVSVSVAIGVGLLLHHQVKQLYEGYTLIETLQHASDIRTGLRRGQWRNLRRVFGHGHPLSWVLPKLGSNGKMHEK
ncbi:hypothetical protein KP509_04G075200 [Ceratopteris richardii]|nr:hypothetical protein KP509_04G075200 [Ceratopteris richardii]